MEHHAERGRRAVVGALRVVVPALVAFEVEGTVAEAGSDMEGEQFMGSDNQT